MADIKKYFDNLPDQSNNHLAGMTASYRFEIEPAGTWTVRIQDGNIQVFESGDAADCTVRVSDQDFSNILDGTLNTQMAFMSGQLLIEGDIGLAMKLSVIL